MSGGKFMKSIANHLASMKEGDPLNSNEEDLNDMFSKILQSSNQEAPQNKLDPCSSFQFPNQLSQFYAASQRNSFFLENQSSNLFEKLTSNYMDKQESNVNEEKILEEIPLTESRQLSDLGEGAFKLHSNKNKRESLRTSVFDQRKRTSFVDSKLIDWSGFSFPEKKMSIQSSSMDYLKKLEDLIHSKPNPQNEKKEKLSLINNKILKRRPSRQALVTIQTKQGKLKELSRSKVRCLCMKSKCLKLYCLCFKNGFSCTEFCTCKGCKNVDKIKSDERRKFKNKVRENLKSNDPSSDFCNCRKNFCETNYCRCKKLNNRCSDKCSCFQCKNFSVPAEGALSDLKRV